MVEIKGVDDNLPITEFTLNAFPTEFVDTTHQEDSAAAQLLLPA